MPTEDMLRHCRDLRTRTYEGTAGEARQETYRQAVALLSPVVLDVLDRANRELLDSTGQVAVSGPRPDGHGGAETVFEMSWPAQQTAGSTRSGRPLEPVRVTARFGADTQHPHLAGTRSPTAPPGDYPMQVTSGADAERQRPIVAAIVDNELHVRVYEGGWQVIPAAHRA